MNKFVKIVSVCLVLSVVIFMPNLEAQSASDVVITFNFNRTSVRGSNQFAVWVTDASGKFIKTLYVTKFTGTGGYQKRPDSLVKWAGSYSKVGLDAATKATPASSAINVVWDYTDASGKPLSKNNEYKIFVEGTSNFKDNVLYTATINSKSKGNVKIATTYSTTDARKSDMIKNLKVTVK